MRGLDGHPADTDRDTGWEAALADYPNIEVVYENWTGWDPSVGAQQALEILTTMEVDGIWTSGIDYTVVEQFEVAGVDYVPIVGADNNEFVGQLIALDGDGLTGAAVSNPPSIGGVGAAVALDILEGQNVAQDADHSGGPQSRPTSKPCTCPASPPVGPPTWRSSPTSATRRIRSLPAKAPASDLNADVPGPSGGPAPNPRTM